MNWIREADLYGKLPKMYQMYLKVYPETSEDEMRLKIEDINTYDPTLTQAAYTPIMLKWYLANQSLDLARVRDYLEIYIKRKDKIPTEYRDLFRFKTADDFITFIDEHPEYATEVEVKQEQQFIEPEEGKVDVLYETGIYKLLKVTNKRALMKLCAGTSLCIRQELHAKRYLKSAPVYIIQKDGILFAALYYNGYWQIMDEHDLVLTDKKIKEIANIFLYLIDKEKLPIEIEYMEHIEDEERKKQELEKIKIDPKAAYEYCRNVLKARWPEAEPYLLKSPYYALQYAGFIIQGRWPEYEKVLLDSNNFGDIWAYIREVVKGRWPEAEPIILQHPDRIVDYCNDIIQTRWPEAESIIMKNPKYAVSYATHIIKGRWIEAELYIMKDADQACRYAENVIKGRWIDAEPIIKQNPMAAFLYAENVIKGPWEEGEKAILSDKSLSYRYYDLVLDKDWDNAITVSDTSKEKMNYIMQFYKRADEIDYNKLARYLEKHDDIELKELYLSKGLASDALYWYAKYVLHGQRWDRGEQGFIDILSRGGHNCLPWIMRYIKNILHSQRWPEFEKVMVKLDLGERTSYQARYIDYVITYVGITRQRWPEVEPLLYRFPTRLKMYEDTLGVVLPKKQKSMLDGGRMPWTKTAVKEKTITVYDFDELSKTLQKKVIEENDDINLTNDWFEEIVSGILDDLIEKGILAKDLNFDVFNNRISLFNPSIDESVLNNLLPKEYQNRLNLSIETKNGETYFIVAADKSVPDKVITDIEDTLFEELHKILIPGIDALSRLYTKLTSDEAIEKTLRANEFNEYGEII